LAERLVDGSSRPLGRLGTFRKYGLTSEKGDGPYSSPALGCWWYQGRYMTWTPVRLAKDLGWAIAFMTGVVGFVKLLVSGWSAVPDVLFWAGVAYGVFALLFCVWGAVKPFAAGMRKWALIALPCYAVIAYSVIGSEPDDRRLALQILAAGGLVWAVGMAWGEYSDWQFRQRVKVRVCPDCAEEVKTAARRCKHCGYRFAP
jgi:Uncharacterised protein family UPF0547